MSTKRSELKVTTPKGSTKSIRYPEEKPKKIEHTDAYGKKTRYLEDKNKKKKKPVKEEKHTSHMILWIIVIVIVIFIIAGIWFWMRDKTVKPSGTVNNTVPPTPNDHSLFTIVAVVILIVVVIGAVAYFARKGDEKKKASQGKK